jgi:hypothetical protein
MVAGKSFREVKILSRCAQKTAPGRLHYLQRGSQERAKDDSI